MKLLPLQALGFCLTLLMHGSVAAADEAKAKTIFKELCAACHGPNGEGQANVAAPAIAGMPAFYVVNQLNKFKSGVRGTHPRDVAGIRMYAMARSVQTDEDVQSIAKHVAGLPTRAAKPTLTGGDAGRGQAAYATCAACHGADGMGNEAMNAPRLAGQNDWYLLTQLTNFKAGIRGGDATKDQVGAGMRAMVAALDDQAFKDLVAYISSLPAPK